MGNAPLLGLLPFNEINMIEINIPAKYDDRTKAYMLHLVSILEKDESIKDVDNTALELFAFCYNSYIIARDLLLKEGLVARDKNGVAVRSHPAVKICHDNEIKMFKILKEFRMTPKGREKLKDENEVSPFDLFTKGLMEQR